MVNPREDYQVESATYQRQTAKFNAQERLFNVYGPTPAGSVPFEAEALVLAGY
jgi:hypothetical protein